MPLHHILTFFNTATAFEDGKRKRLLANNPHPQRCAGFAILLSHTLGICNSDAHLKCATHPQPNYKFGKTWEYPHFARRTRPSTVWKKQMQRKTRVNTAYVCQYTSKKTPNTQYLG